MATRLVQAKIAVDQLDIYELEAMQSHLAALKQKKKSSHFRFLDLPLELRRHVYTFYGQEHLHIEGRESFPSLLRVSRQLRIEFMDVFYSDKTAKLKYLDLENKTRVVFTNPTLLKNVLDHRKAWIEILNPRRHDYGTPLTSMDIPSSSFVYRPRAYLILEVLGTMGKTWMLICMPKEKFEELGAVFKRP